MQVIEANGMRMPKLGLGTWRLSGAECERAVAGALGLGYRHLDTAQMYQNEAAVGAGMKAGGVPREAIHLTTKVWPDNLAPKAMRQAMEDSLRNLGTEYVDLYLIHWPYPDMDLSRALETLTALHQEGKARAIGVSNFTVALLQQCEALGAPIACNQVEYHVLLDQTKLLAHARAKGIVTTAYCPLAQGRLAGHAALDAIAAKHGCTAAQVAIAWLLAQDLVAAIPKAGRRESQLANLAALDITLDADDLAAIAALPKNERCVSPSFAPQWD